MAIRSCSSSWVFLTLVLLYLRISPSPQAHFGYTFRQGLWASSTFGIPEVISSGPSTYVSGRILGERIEHHLYGVRSRWRHPRGVTFDHVGSSWVLPSHSSIFMKVRRWSQLFNGARGFCECRVGCKAIARFERQILDSGVNEPSCGVLLPYRHHRDNCHHAGSHGGSGSWAGVPVPRKVPGINGNDVLASRGTVGVIVFRNSVHAFCLVDIHIINNVLRSLGCYDVDNATQWVPSSLDEGWLNWWPSSSTDDFVANLSFRSRPWLVIWSKPYLTKCPYDDKLLNLCWSMECLVSSTMIHYLDHINSPLSNYKI